VKVFFDHNMSPAMARAFRELFKDQHTIVALAEKFPRNIPDVGWITELGHEGQWVIISGDRRITRNHAEYQAFRASSLIGFFLSKGLYKSSVAKQMERILALWNNIETVSKTVQAGAMFELPINGQRVRQLKL
jgi:hypothetical protein